MLCIVTFYQVVITLCKGEVGSIKFGTFRGSCDTSDTANIRNDGLEGEYYLDLSQRSIKPGKVKSVSLVRRRLAQTRGSSQIKSDGGILFPSFQSRSSPKILQYSSLG